MRPTDVAPSPVARASMRAVAVGFRSCLFTQTQAGIPKCRASASTRSKSCSPERVGSATMRTRFAPLKHAITGQPMPGGPSMRTSGHPASRATRRASPRTAETSLPEFPWPGRRRAWTIGPKRELERNHSPVSAGSRRMASPGQWSWQTPQPSQALGSTRNV